MAKKKPAVPERLRRQTQERAIGLCEYCLVHESDAYYPYEPDHIIAEKHNGQTSLENLAWSCIYCNRCKGSDIASVDPKTHKIVPLYNPREQKWNRHFQLNGALIEGITASGRATVSLLQINDIERVNYRLGLIEAGHYPNRK